MIEQLHAVSASIVGMLSVLLGILASGHAVYFKRDSRAALAWVGVIWLVPVVGPVLYFLFGINRIKRRARSRRSVPIAREFCQRGGKRLADSYPRKTQQEIGALKPLANLVEQLTQWPVLEGNQILPLENGEEAYPQMLQAIAEAKAFVVLSTYIFNYDPAGILFLNALKATQERGVLVRVLLDAVGIRYSGRSMYRAMKRAGIPVARFFPSLYPGWLPYMNLRNHRKLLVIDGKIGFTGGMNIKEGHNVRSKAKDKVQDLHFRLQGPVVSHLQFAFIQDWAFITREFLEGDPWNFSCETHGEIPARGIIDGPDEYFEHLRWTLLGALHTAQRSVKIITPYFVPDQTLITALNLCALKGIKVEILLPQENNLRLVQWASTAQFWQLLEKGCRIWLSPPPFDHTKLMVIDDHWVLLGSGNWDMRSLRLNFEFNVECYDTHFASTINQIIAGKFAQAREMTLEKINARSFPVKIRDGVARLFSPFL